MRLSSLAVARPITTMMIFVAIVLLGLVSYRRLPVQLLPDIEFPVVVVFVSNDNSTEENLEEVTKPLEATISEMPRVRQLRSSTGPNFVRMRVELEHGTDLQYATVDLEERLVAFRESLDDRRTFINAFPFSTSDFNSTFMFLSVRAAGDSNALFRTVGDRVEQQLRSISGIANVEISGREEDAVQVDLKPDLLANYGLDMGSVIQRVQAAATSDTFLGRLQSPRETFFVRLEGRVETMEELAELYVDSQGVVKLKDVATIETGAAADQRISRSNGKNAINIRLERESGRNMLELAEATRRRVEEINRELPPGTELVIEEDLASYVEEAIDQVILLAGQGALLALLVPLVFFRSLRVSMIVFTTVPVCLIAVFNLFYAAGLSINIFSIVGLALGIGMLVDNSIVVTENALRLYQRGVPAAEASGRGGMEVGRGLLASTLTTVVVFIPIAFLEGSEFREIAREPTLALVFPLLLSLVVALTLVPVLVNAMLHTKGRVVRVEDRRSWFRDAFGSVLKSALRYRGRVLFIILLVILLTALESCRRINQTATSQEANREWMQVYFQVPRGSTLSEANTAATLIEDRVIKHPDVRKFTVSFNQDGGEVGIWLKERAERSRQQPFREIQQTMVEFIGPIPNAELSLQRFDDPLSETPLDLGTEAVLELRGLDLDILFPYAERLIDALRTHPQITNAEVKEEQRDQEYLARVDREKAQLFDVNAQTLGRYISATRSSGTVSSLVLEKGDLETEVSFTISESAGDTIDAVKSMTVFSPVRGSVPLGELASFQTSQSPTRIRRTDRQASIELSYYYLPTANASALVEDVKRILAGLPNQGGVVAAFQGEAQRVEQREGQVGFVLLAGAALVYVVMAAVFESFWIPFIILATNPLMLIGIVWGLDIAGLPFDDFAAFGVILLVGVAVNNGIVMMDRTLDLQRQGYGRTRAIYSAAITRLRPITMTYLTTVLGLLPMALVGEEGDQWRPVAVVIIGGLTSATVLTLVVLPCFYVIGDDFMRWARQPFLNFLAVCFEIVEGITNSLLHPVKVLRRQMPFAPSLWPFLRAVRGFAWELLRTPVKLVLSAPGDAWFLIRGARVEAGAEPRPLAQAPLEPAAMASRAPVSISNLQVHFPPTGLRAVVARVPEKLRRRWMPDPRGVQALAGIHLDMRPGLFGLLGPNGAGKTTLLRCIAGLMEPTRGTVRIFGVPHRDAPAQLAPLIGYLPQNHGHYDWMTLYEYLHYFATLTAQTLERAKAVEPEDSPLRRQLERLTALQHPAARHQAILDAAAEVNLSDVLHQPVGSFSGGMKQRAGIARILLQAPPILIVDEPTAGLDPIERVKVRLLLSRLARTHLVIFSTHIVEDLEQACNQIAILDKGHLVFSGPPDELLAGHTTLEGALLQKLGR